ncbi:MAG: FeoA family protein [Dermatophilaceae bacterium]
MGASTVESLADWPLGQDAVVARADGGELFRRRLAHLGLRAGAVVRPLHRTPGRGLVLAVGDSRVALDRASVAVLHVTAGGSSTAGDRPGPQGPLPGLPSPDPPRGWSA